VLLLVRHSLPELDPGIPATEWRLSDEGRRRCGPLAERLAAFRPKALVSSTEPKARETAELIAPSLGLEVELSDGLRETARRSVPWLSRDQLHAGMRALFERPHEIAFGEESASAALARFEAAVEGLVEPAVVVSHGAVISLYVAAKTGRNAFELWQSLELPDVVEA
jgi:broad specificity phosphatase PhoE